MALFKFRLRKPFRVRSLARDAETDSARAERLFAQIDALREEIERERNGLRDRHQSVTAQAAFSQALEDDEAIPMSSAISDLTGAMIRYEARIAALEKQIDFVTGLRAQATLFPHENEQLASSAADLQQRLA